MLDDMAKRVKQLMETSQKLGEEGEVDRSLQAAQDADKIKTEKENLEQRFKYPGGRIMFVCDVCGVFINSTDNEARRADHYNGKQYLGWKAIRDKLKFLDNKLGRYTSVVRCSGQQKDSGSSEKKNRREVRDDCLSPRRGRSNRRSCSRSYRWQKSQTL